MGRYDVHDTLYGPNGAFLSAEGNCSILLKKSYSSVVYCPAQGQRPPGAMYPRCICLEHNGEKNGTLLATMECYTDESPVFPIYESTDAAKSWHYLSSVADEACRTGVRFQPHLFELPCDMGRLKEGTILCAGNIIPEKFRSTSLRLYMSTDAGKSWAFVSEIVHGIDASEEEPHGLPVWEPFLLDSPDGKLYCYYSDESYRNTEKYHQLLAHKVSEDGGFTWSEEKRDVAFADGKLRPGMPIVAKLPGRKFIMVYEMVNEDRIPVYFRISDSMDDWGDPDFMGNPVIAEDGSYLTGTPYVAWIPQGGAQGTILVSGRGFSRILANSRGGEGFWEPMEALVDIDNRFSFPGYSQCLLPLDGGRQLLNLCPRQISDRLALIESAVADVYVRA